jgi:hypothetical protein
MLPQLFPTDKVISKLGSKAASKFLSLEDNSENRVELPQHFRLPVPELQPEVPAVTLLAMVKEATKEMRDLWNSMV